MDQAVDTILDLDECAKVRQIAHAAVDTITHLITLRQGAPRIILHLLHSEADAPCFGIDAQNFDFHRIARADSLARMLDPFGPAHL